MAGNSGWPRSSSPRMQPDLTTCNTECGSQAGDACARKHATQPCHLPARCAVWVCPAAGSASAGTRSHCSQETAAAHAAAAPGCSSTTTCAKHIAAARQPAKPCNQATNVPRNTPRNDITHRPDALCGCAQQLAVHLQALALAARRKQRLPTQQLPQDAPKCPCVYCRAVAAAAQQQLRRPVPQSDDSRGEAPSVRVKVPVSRHSV
jgi:hypothetical protein